MGHTGTKILAGQFRSPFLQDFDRFSKKTPKLAPSSGGIRDHIVQGCKSGTFGLSFEFLYDILLKVICSVNRIDIAFYKSANPAHLLCILLRAMFSIERQ